jgi:hypothetical protein
MKKITHKTSNKIAKSVLTLLHRVDPRTINIEDQIDAHLKNVGLGWKLKEGTYIDGLACNSIKILAHDIRLNAIEKF